MRVYRLEVMVIDHDCLGDRVMEELESARFPNDCMSPQVASRDSREVEWSDRHPLNLRSKWVAAFRELFGCQACAIEAEIGTEEQPHPVPEKYHTCVRKP